MRTKLKEIVPLRAWPLFRFFDRYLINAMYAGFAFERLLKRQDNVFSLPGQPITVLASSINFGSDPARLEHILDKHGIRYKSGRHSVYLGDCADIDRVSRSLCGIYPERVGLKLIKSRQISGDATPYYTSAELAPASTRSSMVAVGSMLEKVIVSNLLHAHRVAPRVYDLVKLVSEDGGFHFGFVVQPVDGAVVTGAKGEAFITAFKQTLASLHLKTVSIGEHCDLRPPDFRHNIMEDENGVYYVDIQNFVFKNQLYKREPETAVSKRFADDLLSRFVTHYSIESFQRFNDALLELINLFSLVSPAMLIVDACTGIGTAGIGLLSSGKTWVHFIRDKEDARIVRSFLYSQGYTRFAIEDLGPAAGVSKSVAADHGKDLVIIGEKTDTIERLSAENRCRFVIYIQWIHKDSAMQPELQIAGCLRLVRFKTMVLAESDQQVCLSLYKKDGSFC